MSSDVLKMSDLHQTDRDCSRTCQKNRAMSGQYQICNKQTVIAAEHDRGQMSNLIAAEHVRTNRAMYLIYYSKSQG